MGTLKTSNESENKTENSLVINDSRSGIEDMVNNPSFAEVYNISKAYVKYLQKMRKISLDQPCLVESTSNFDEKVAYLQNSKSEDLPVILTEFETMRTHILKTDTKSDCRNPIASLHDKIVSSSIEEVPIIGSSDSTESVLSSKEEHSARGSGELQERRKNFTLQKVSDSSSIKNVISSSLPILASKVETKATPSNQSNFQIGKTGAFVEVSYAEDLFVGNIFPSAASKKRKYKVKVKILRKKPKHEASPPPPKSPPPPPPPKLPPLPPPSKLPPHSPKLPPTPKLPPPLPSPLKLPPLPPYPPLPSPLKLPPLPPYPPPPSILSLPLSRSSLTSYLKSPPPPPPGSPPIPIVSSPPRSPTLVPLPRQSKSRKATLLSSYPQELQTGVPNQQLQQAVQTTHYNVEQLHYLQENGHNIPYTIYNNYPFYFRAPHTVPFYPNYPPTSNTQMYAFQQLPVQLDSNQQPEHSQWSAGNFVS